MTLDECRIAAELAGSLRAARDVQLAFGCLAAPRLSFSFELLGDSALVSFRAPVSGKSVTLNAPAEWAMASTPPELFKRLVCQIEDELRDLGVEVGS